MDGAVRWPKVARVEALIISGAIKCLRSMSMMGVDTLWEAAVAVPARDEEVRILGCITALAAAIRHSDRRTGIVLVVNNSTDDTYAIAAGWLAHAGIPHVLLDVDFQEGHAFVGSARRLALDLAAELVGKGGILFTTDADSAVDREWIIDGREALEHRADLICGTIIPLEDEQGIFPVDFGERCAAEGEYMALSIQLESLLDPRLHDLHPVHNNAGGASLAFGKSLYIAIGGMPSRMCGEDRAFVATAEKLDYRVLFSSNFIVRTSCRLKGRATGGMADALTSRIMEENPLCDETLLDAEASAWKFWLRGRLRQYGSVNAGQLILHQLFAEPEKMYRRNNETFGGFWERVSKDIVLPGRHRLRMNDVVRELPAMRIMVKELNAGSDPGDNVHQARCWIKTCLKGDLQRIAKRTPITEIHAE